MGHAGCKLDWWVFDWRVCCRISNLTQPRPHLALGIGDWFFRRIDHVFKFFRRGGEHAATRTIDPCVDNHRTALAGVAVVYLGGHQISGLLYKLIEPLYVMFAQESHGQYAGIN